MKTQEHQKAEHQKAEHQKAEKPNIRWFEQPSSRRSDVPENLEVGKLVSSL
jgi:hypothetical protein